MVSESATVSGFILLANHRSSTYAITYDAVYNQQGPLKTFICPRLGIDQVDESERTVDGSGRTLFTYGLSDDLAKAKKQKECVAEAIELKPTCR